MFWVIVATHVVLYVAAPATLVTLASTSITLWIIAAALVFNAALWATLALNTLRLVRLMRAAPSTRAWVAGVTGVVVALTSGRAACGAYLASTAGGFVNEAFAVAAPEPPIDGRYNIMLLGGDAGQDREGLRPELITVASINSETRAATQIGLPRTLQYMPFVEGSPLVAAYPNGYGTEGCEVDGRYIGSIYTEVELYSPDPGSSRKCNTF